MAKIDEVKEIIGYLKVIFALLLATVIGLVGWLVQSYKTVDSLLILAGIFLIFMLVCILFFINKRIFSDIGKLEEL